MLSRTDMKLTYLDDLCLGKIISLLDCASFQAVILTCRRLYEVGNRPGSWSPFVVKRRLYYLCCNGVFSLEKNTTDLPQNFQELMKDAKLLTENLELLKYDTFKTVWSNFGPVAGRLYLTLRSVKNINSSLETRACCSLKCRQIEFGFSNEKTLITRLASFFDGSLSFESQTKLLVSYDSRSVIYNSGYNSDRYNVLDKELESEEFVKTSGVNETLQTESSDLQCLEPVMKLVEEEFGQTQPQMSPQFLIYFLKCMPYVNGLPLSGERPRFKDDNKNLQDELEARLILAESRFRLTSKFVKKWKENLQELDNGRELVWCLSVVTNKFGREAIEAVDMKVESLLNAREEMKHFKSWSCPGQNMINNLLNRIDFETVENGWTCVGNADKNFFAKVDVHLNNGKKLVITTSWRTAVTGIFHLTLYNDQEITFHQPDENIEIKLAVGVENGEVLQIEKLEPIRKLIHDCIYHGEEQTEAAPHVSNAFIAWFFVSVLKDTRKTFGQCLMWLRSEVKDNYERKDDIVKSVTRSRRSLGENKGNCVIL